MLRAETEQVDNVEISNQVKIISEPIVKQSSLQKTETDHQAYTEKRTKLLNLINSTRTILSKLSSDKELEIPSLDSLLILKTQVKFHGSQSSSGFDSAFSSQFIHSKLNESLEHLERLYARISDTRSRVLVTGDLNAGKSTFVNAMLRRECLPSDQQPCTALFAEVIDAEQNGGVEVFSWPIYRKFMEYPIRPPINKMTPPRSRDLMCVS